MRISDWSADVCSSDLEETKKLSNGDLTVRVYTDAQLGNISKMLSSMQLGTLEMGYFGLGSVIFLRGAEPLNILYAPYLFKSGEWAERILNNDEFAKIYDTVAKKSGVRVFAAYGIRSPRALQTVDKPIREPEDRSEEHTSELKSLMRTSYAFFCLTKHT